MEALLVAVVICGAIFLIARHATDTEPDSGSRLSDNGDSSGSLLLLDSVASGDHLTYSPHHGDMGCVGHPGCDAAGHH